MTLMALVPLEVDVNGEEIFFVDKEILSSYCDKVGKLFSKPSVMERTKNLKVILHELPGGAEAFELITRFCYRDSKIQLTPSNTCMLHCAARSMEMPRLVKEAEKSLEGVSYWTWSEVIGALKQCQGYFVLASSSGTVDKLLDSVVVRIAMHADASPTSSSPESSGFRFSFDTRSTLSTRTAHQKTWWFEDLASLNLRMVEKVVKEMIARKLDHVFVSRFLLFYLKASLEEKKQVTEAVVDLLYSLDRSSVPYKSLFGFLRASSTQNLSKLCRSRLESMIGVHIDQVVLDSLLVQAPIGMESLYDVDLVLRFVKFFLASGGRKEMDRLKKVGSLMDLYLTEVAPDSGLKPLKFLALATALPDEASDSHDAMYRAIDVYFEVHTQLSEEEKMNICCAINYEKLSSETCKHLTKNSKFPSRTAIQALIFQHSKLKNLLKDTDNVNPHCKEQQSDNEQIILYAKKLDLTVENKKLRAKLRGMQWRVMELEKVCKKMQIQMAKGSQVSRHNRSSRSLPKMCS